MFKQVGVLNLKSKVCGCYSVKIIKWPHTCNWCVVRWQSKNKHLKRHMLKRDWSMSLSFINYSTHNSVHNFNGRGIKRTCTFDDHNQIMKVLFFQSKFGSCFIIVLLVQHEFRCVNLIGRSWRTWKLNWITPTYLSVKRTSLFGRIVIAYWHGLVTHKPRVHRYDVTANSNVDM